MSGWIERLYSLDFTQRRIGMAAPDPWREGWNRALEVAQDDLRATLANTEGEEAVCFNCAREHVLNCDPIPAVGVRADDAWCRREDCQYRNWRSGSMPTHRKGAGCPGEGVCTYTTSTADYCHTHDAYLAHPDGRCEKATGAGS